MFNFTPKDVERQVRTVASEYPNYVYSSNGVHGCYYFHPGPNSSYVCGCIIGHALHRLGVTPANIPGANGVNVGVLFSHYMSIANSDARANQDRGVSWGECIRKADDAAF
jgi:hypothetical protein